MSIFITIGSILILLQDLFLHKNMKFHVLSIRMHVKSNVYFINNETPNRSEISTTYL